MSDEHGANPHGEQGADTPSGDSAREDLKDWFKSEMSGLESRLQRFAQSAAKSHTEREFKKRAELESEAAPVDRSSDDSGEGASKPDSKVASLERRIAALQKEADDAKSARKEEADARAQESREAKLRRMVEAANVSDVEAVFRYVKADLKVNEDGEYEGSIDDVDLPAKDFIAEAVKANSWMQPIQDRQGGGAIGGERASSRSSNADLEKLPPHERLLQLASGSPSKR